MTKIIGTHSGTFHADESLACFMLHKTAAFAGAEIVRTRDAAKLASCDILVDVGGVYDPATHRYDHHQRGFTETMTIDDKKFETKLSSAGLIYRHFGREVIAQLCGWDLKERAADVEKVYLKIYQDFVEAMDAIDNGVDRYPKDIKPLYRDSTGLAARISRMAPWWNEPSSDEELDSRFRKAMALAGGEFTERVRYLGLAHLPARAIVQKALERRFDYDASGNMIVFEEFVPWKEILLDLEVELGITKEQQPIYALYEDQGGSWRVQAVPTSPSSFENRKPLPEPWRGIRDEELSQLSSIPNCIFVHAGGFIGGNKTRDGAFAMAKKALVDF